MATAQSLTHFVALVFAEKDCHIIVGRHAEGRTSICGRLPRAEKAVFKWSPEVDVAETAHKLWHEAAAAGLDLESEIALPCAECGAEMKKRFGARP